MVAFVLLHVLQVALLVVVRLCLHLSLYQFLSLSLKLALARVLSHAHQLVLNHAAKVHPGNPGNPAVLVSLGVTVQWVHLVLLDATVHLVSPDVPERPHLLLHVLLYACTTA